MQLPDRFLSHEELLQVVAYAVEANSFERQALWQKTKDKVVWGEGDFGFGTTIGTLGTLPVFLSLMFQRIDGQLVVFYEATSRVVDHDMVKDWLIKNIPAITAGDRRAMCDAGNFHLCWHHIADLNKAAAAVPA